MDVVSRPLRSVLLGALFGAAGAWHYSATNSSLLVVLLWAAVAFVMREPRVSGLSGIALELVCLGAASQLFPGTDSKHWAEVLIASQVVPRAAMAVLAWIARPAASGSSVDMSSTEAIFSIALGVLSAFLTGWPALLLMAALLLIVRLALGWSYQSMGGINRNSLGWVRQTLEVLVLLIVRLPISSLYFDAR